MSTNEKKHRGSLSELRQHHRQLTGLDKEEAPHAAAAPAAQPAPTAAAPSQRTPLPWEGQPAAESPYPTQEQIVKNVERGLAERAQKSLATSLPKAAEQAAVSTAQSLGSRYSQNKAKRLGRAIETWQPMALDTESYLGDTDGSLREKQADDEHQVRLGLATAKAELADVEQRIGERGAAVDRENAAVPSYATGTVGSMGAAREASNLAARYSDSDLSTLRARESQLKQLVSNLQYEQDRLQGKEHGFWRGLADTFTWDNYDFGFRNLNAASRLLAIKRKMEGGATLTDDEQALLAETYQASEAAAATEGQRSFMNRAGRLTGGMIPLMAQMAVGGFVTGAAKLGTKLGTKAAGLVAGNVAKNVLRATGTAVGDLAGGYIIANTAGAMNTAADIATRYTGSVVQDDDGEGYHFDGGLNLLRAIYEGETAQAIEYGTELAGESSLKLLNGAVGQFTKPMAKRVAQKLGMGSAVSAVQRMGKSAWATTAKNVLARAGISGYLGEVEEEEAGIILSSLLVGDQKLSDLWDARTQLDIWGGMLFSIGAMQAAPAGLGAVQYYRTKRAVDKADKVASFRLTDARWQPLRERIDSATNEEMADVGRDIIADPDLHTEEKRAAMNYVQQLVKYRGFNVGSQSKAAAEADTPEGSIEAERSAAYVQGHEATAQQKNDIKLRYECSKAELVEATRRENLFNDGEEGNYDFDDSTTDDNLMHWLTTAVRDDYASRGSRGERRRTRALIRAALEYLNAKAAWEGVLQGARDRMEDRIDATSAAIDSHTHREDGQVHRATLSEKADDGSDQYAYVVGGQAVMLPDGTGIDREASSRNLIVRDATTGELRFITPRDLVRVEAPIDPEQEKQAAAETIRQAAAEQESREIDGELAFSAGDTFTILDADGQPHTVQVAEEQVDDPDTVGILYDGQPMAHSRTRLQQMADAYNQQRLETSVAERNAAQAEADSEQDEASGEQDAQALPLDLDDTMTIATADGHTLQVTVTATPASDGTLERGQLEVSITDEAGQERVQHLTPEEVSSLGRITAYNGEPVAAQAPTQDAGAAAGNGETNAAQLGRSLTEQEASDLISQMQASAETGMELELTPENWLKEFGEDGRVATPIGAVKMGDNQYLKLLKKGRELYFGMVKPTLTNPDLILEEYDPKDGAERETKYIFVKTFLKADGSRYVNFESVTVQKDNLEVSISSNEITEQALAKKVHQDKLIHLNKKFSSSEMRLAEPQSEGSDIVPTPNSVASASKDSQESINDQTQSEVNSSPSALSRIPVDEAGNRLYEQADPGDTWEALVELNEGDEAAATDTAKAMADNARAAYKKADKKKATGATPEEIAAGNNARKKLRADIQKSIDYWDAVTDYKAAQQRQAQHEAAEQRAAQAKADKQKREAEAAAAAEAERKERERISGVPDVVNDTAADARARGFRNVSGTSVDRQAQTNGVVGRESRVKFSQKDTKTGRIKVIDAKELQPSHVGGQRNPRFFIDEAQPKDRTDNASSMAAAQIAANINPEEITGDGSAYQFSAPTVNTRGEVIQGNNRSEALKLMWGNGAFRGAQEAYKQYLIDHAADFGLDAEAVAAMEAPVMVNEIDVDDAEAIRLGQLKASNLESGGIVRIDPVTAARTLGGKVRNFAGILLNSSDENASLSDLIVENGKRALEYLHRQGAIDDTQIQSTFDTRGNLTPEAKADLQNILKNTLFEGGVSDLPAMFNAMPAKAQKAILSTFMRDFDSPEASRILPELQKAIEVWHEAAAVAPEFAQASNYEDAKRAMYAYTHQYQMRSGESVLPAEQFSNFAIELATRLQGGTMRSSQQALGDFFDLVQGKGNDLFSGGFGKPVSLAEAIKTVFSIDYKPVKKQSNGQERSNTVAHHDTASPAGRQGEQADASSGESAQTGTAPTDSGAGTHGDGSTKASSDDGRGGRTLATKREAVVSPTQEQVTAEERTAMQSRIVDWLSEDNLSKAEGKSREEFFEMFGNEPEPIAYIPQKYLPYVSADVTDPRIYCGKGYFIDHALRNHGQSGTQVTIDDVDVSKYLNIQSVLDAPDAIKETVVDGKRTVVFVKKIGRYFAELTQVEEDGKIILHKSLFNQKKEPYAKLDDIRSKGSSSVGGTSTISHADETAPAISLQSRGDDISSDGKGTQTSETQQEEVGENAENSANSTTEAIQQAEQEVDTNPTEAQKEAGNYKKGHVKVDGYDISIEQPKGSVRTGKDKEGNILWQNEMHNTYGYIRDTESTDGDHIDVFLSDNPEQGNVYVIDQVDPKTGKFDEHKVMYGFNSMEEARAAYLSNYEKGWKGLGNITEVSKEEFKKWIDSSHRKSKPFAEYKSVKATAAASGVAPRTNGYTIEKCTSITKKGEDGFAVNFTERVDKDEFKGQCTIAKKLGGWYSRGKGFLFKDEDAAHDFAETVIGRSKEEIKDEAPLSLADMQGKEETASESASETTETTEAATPASEETTQEGQTDEMPTQVDEKALMAALNVGISASPRDFAIGMPPTQHRINIGIAGAMAQYKSFIQVRKLLEKQGYKLGENVWKAFEVGGHEAYHKGDISLGELVSALDAASAPKTETKDKPQKEKPKQKPATNPSGNKLVTDERYAQLRERMRKKLGGQMNMGVDPEILAIGTEMAVYHIEKGARKFVDYAKAMIEDLGDVIRPYLKSFYNGARDLPEMEELAKEMTPYNEVSRIDTENFDKEGAKDFIATAKTIVREQEAEREKQEAEEKLKAERNAARKAKQDAIEAEAKRRGLKRGDKVLYKRMDGKEKWEEATITDFGGGVDVTLDTGGAPVMYEAAEFDQVKPMPKAEKSQFEQWKELKAKNPDALLLFRAGDFYETYNEDAQKAGEILGLTLTHSKNSEFDNMAGFPYHALDTYLPKLIRAGQRVAICDQLDNPNTKKLVKRGTPKTETIEPSEQTQAKEKPAKEKKADKKGVTSQTNEPSLFDKLNTQKDETDNTERTGQAQGERVPWVVGGVHPDRNGVLESDGIERNDGGKPTSTEQGSMRVDGGERTGLSTVGSVGSAAPQDYRGDTVTGGKSGRGDSLRNGDKENGRSDGGRNNAGAEKPSEAVRADDGSVKTANERTTPLNTRNYLYPKDGADIDNMSERERLGANVEALETLAKVIREDRTATAEERATMGKFRGWGGIDIRNVYSVQQLQANKEWDASTHRYVANPLLEHLGTVIQELDPNNKRNIFADIRTACLTSYYTPLPIARSMNNYLSLAGYHGGGSLLDPSMGSGVFEGTLPKSIQQRTRIHGVELDWLTAQIAKQLYPDAHIENNGYQDAKLAANSFDIVESNIPFGSISVYDPSWKHDSSPAKKAAQGKIHTYFAVKMMENAKPGGLVTIMVSNSIMDTQGNGIIRNELLRQGEFLGAIRLSSGVFKGAGTSPVTDIIFMRKWKDDTDRENVTANHEYKTKTADFLSTTYKEAKNPTDGNIYSIPFNGYYNAHPEMMLGTVEAGGLYRADAFNLTSGDNAEETARKMDKLIKDVIVGKRKGTLYDTHRTEREVQQAVREAYVGDGNYQTDGNIVEQNGKIGFLTTEGKDKKLIFEERPNMARHAARIKTYIPIRTALKKLVAAQINREEEAKINLYRHELNTAYKAFTSKYGLLNDDANIFIMDDIDGYLMRSLEDIDTTTKKLKGLADIFTKNTIKGKLDLSKAKDPATSIAMSLAEYGEIRPSFMEQTLGKNWREQCKSKLFHVPFTEDSYVVADDYLSGDVKTKLEDARRAAEQDESFKENVTALEKVQPRDLAITEISIRMGARWLPDDVYNDFMHEMFGMSTWRGSKSGVRYVPEADDFIIEVNKNELGGNADKWSTERKSAKEIFEAALKDKTLKIYDHFDDGRTVLNQKQTQLANDKVQDMREKFETWVANDPERAEKLAAMYNDKFNRTVIRQWNGDFLDPVGLQGKTLRPHQKAAVWMLLNNRGGIVDHIVGAGKTLVMQSAIMEMRRMGIAKKPMIVALKATVGQIAKDFMQAYPHARILAPSEKDFDGKNRKKMLAKISTGDYDCIILSHEQYNQLPHTEEIETQTLREQLEQLDAAILLLHGSDSTSQLTKRQLKGLEKRRENLKAKMQKLQDRKVDREFCFENLGVDYLFVDECQQYKALPYVTTYNEVAGLGSAEGSQRAVAMLNGVRYLQQLHQGDRGTVFLSGTTITNSLVEVYNLLNYLRPNTMRQYGYTTFDAWAAQYAVRSSDLEYGVTNQLKEKSRFRAFENVCRFNIEVQKFIPPSRLSATLQGGWEG